MKPVIVLCALAATLVGCITEPKTITEDHEIDPSCFHEDSTTWTDTTDATHMSCKIDPSVNPVPGHP